jgi:hypothetical protein
MEKGNQRFRSDMQLAIVELTPDLVPLFDDSLDPPLLDVRFFFTVVDVPFRGDFFEVPDEVPFLGLSLMDTRPLEVLFFS